MNTNKELLATRLRWVFESQSFSDFYTGPMDDAITGEFNRGTPEYQKNENKIKESLDKMADKLIA